MLLYINHSTGLPTQTKTLSNTQCDVPSSGVSATVSADTKTFTLTLSITFKSTFVGVQNIYGQVTSDNGAASPYFTMGTWQAFAASADPPTLVSLNPTSGSGAEATFTLVTSSVNGWRYIANQVLLVNSTVSLPGSCTVMYNRGPNLAWLINSAGDNWLTGQPVYPGVSGTASNGRCTLNGPASSASSSGNQVTVSLALSFDAAMAGNRNVYALVTDKGAHDSGWQDLGDWTVPGGPAITSFSPSSAALGALITVNGDGFVSGSNGPTVTLNKLGGGTIAAPVASATASQLTFVIPAGATTGPITVTVAGNNAVSGTSLVITASSDFTLSASPSAANLIQGQKVSYLVSLSAAFPHLATLAVSGVPSGVTAAFTPSQITGGAASILTLSAPAGQAPGTSNLTVSGTAVVDGITLQHTAAISVTVQTPTTSFIGRVVETNELETAISGIVVKMLGKDDTGATTGCTGQSTSDAAGNFALTGLAGNCVGRQLVRFNDTPDPNYGAVDLIFELTSGQVTASPVLVHLPKLTDSETFNIIQNHTADQTFVSAKIPGFQFTVYAGTVLIRASDGTQPNPYPLKLSKIPIDRLPDYKPPVPGMSMTMLVSFSPVGSASKQVAVWYPNTAGLPPGTLAVTLMTLDPSKGTMVPYGTGTVSSDATAIIPDDDPGNPGQRWGIRNFDWHGLMPPPAPISPCPECPKPETGDPVDLSSGLQVVRGTDIAFGGLRGGVSIQRVYRNLMNDSTAFEGPFGHGTGHNYSYRLGLVNPVTDPAFPLIMPDGSRFRFVRQADGTLINTDTPAMRGAVITTSSAGAELRWKDGVVYEFSSGGFFNKIRDPNGNTVTINRDGNPLRINSVVDAVGRSLTFEYDGASSRIARITDPLGRQVNYSYSSGRLTTVTKPDGRTIQYVYSASGLLTSITNERGIVVAANNYETGPDISGRVMSQTRAAGGGNIAIEYTPVNPTVFGVSGGTSGGGGAWVASGPVASPILKAIVTDPRGNKTEYRFDSNGFPQQVTDALGQTRVFVREPGTNMLLATKGNGVCDICGDTAAGDLFYEYDSKGNVTKVTDALGTTEMTYEPVFSRVTQIKDALNNITQFTYDAKGNLLTRKDANNNVTRYVYNAYGLLTDAIDPLDRHTTFGYDDKGNLIWVTDPLGNKTTIGYDAVSRPIRVTDALGRKTTTVYDAMDRVISQTDGKNQTVTFEYDAAGNLTKLTDPRGKFTTFTYDNLNRLETRTDPLNKTDTRTYDFNGNLISFQDRRGQVSTFEYDALDRLTKETYADSVVDRFYDAHSRLVRAVDSASGTFQFAYDGAGNLLKTVNPVGSVDYLRDALGRVMQRQVVGQTAQTHTYDPAGNLLTAVLGGTSVSYGYDVLNRVTSMNRGNGVNTTFAYDPAGRLKSITHGSVGTELFEYDAAGQRVKRATPFAQALTTTASTTTVDDANRIVTRDAATHTHDFNGNRTGDGVNTYVWDSRNRLTSMTTPSGTFTFTYDPAGNLIRQTSPAGMQEFVLDDLTNIAYTNGASFLTARGIDSHLAAIAAGSPTYSLTDAINSTAATTDATGAVVTRYFYEPYGQTSSTGPGSYLFQYTGRVPVTGNIYHYRARFYDALAARFLSEDPIGFAGLDWHLYRYVANSPISFVDPEGLLPEPPSLTASLGKLSLDLLNTIPMLKQLSDYSAGAGDLLTLGGTTWVLRTEGLGVAEVVDRCSLSYRLGQVTGAIVQNQLATLGIARAAGMATRIAIHGPHHFFPALGARAWHLQLNLWLTGVKGSGFALRLPLWPI